jgi:serine/threonine protein kinase
VDVFSLGNIFYMLLMMELPFQELTAQDAAEKIKTGERPSFYEDVWDSPDPYIQALKSAMIMCHHHNATQRATARQVETFLKDQLLIIGPGSSRSRVGAVRAT